jgi:hypothetical protein
MLCTRLKIQRCTRRSQKRILKLSTYLFHNAAREEKKKERKKDIEENDALKLCAAQDQEREKK